MEKNVPVVVELYDSKSFKRSIKPLITTEVVEGSEKSHVSVSGKHEFYSKHNIVHVVP